MRSASHLPFSIPRAGVRAKRYLQPKNDEPKKNNPTPPYPMYFLINPRTAQIMLDYRLATQTSSKEKEKKSRKTGVGRRREINGWDTLDGVFGLWLFFFLSWWGLTLEMFLPHGYLSGSLSRCIGSSHGYKVICML